MLVRHLHAFMEKKHVHAARSMKQEMAEDVEILQLAVELKNESKWTLVSSFCSNVQQNPQ